VRSHGGQLKRADLSSIRPDWRLVKLLASLPQAQFIISASPGAGGRGIRLGDSTVL
jgi:hypothetical protein